MKTRLSRAAAEDLKDILVHLSSQTPSAVRGFRDRFRRVRTQIGDFPQTGYQTDDPSLRSINLGRYPYLVFFEPFEDNIVIMRIVHGALDPETLPARPR
ncbi:type II toxin-antitoxin system RelE/ParE family toxin [Aquibium carbonis]|uniref:Type II toxin-antitoxin system RelE/ParE family toxin n=1 Tax=Aquibium carbonis TaxID=2495581 RepID=A0A429Z398_9HYPH|nr:type II toxin-antitoxin system RelE/ParE family toxin [Aquibium carbonis]RST88167.1 type II toxin-antitoxin system RelE/ParE family toxin [Aquibium carbonis]